MGITIRSDSSRGQSSCLVLSLALERRLTAPNHIDLAELGTLAYSNLPREYGINRVRFIIVAHLHWM